MENNGLASKISGIDKKGDIAKFIATACKKKPGKK